MTHVRAFLGQHRKTVDFAIYAGVIYYEQV